MRYRTLIKQTTPSHIYVHPKKLCRYSYTWVARINRPTINLSSQTVNGFEKEHTHKKIKEALTTLCVQEDEFVDVSTLKINNNKKKIETWMHS